MPIVLRTTPRVDATAFSNQRHEDVCQDGTRWLMIQGSGSSSIYLAFMYSKDDGETWTLAHTRSIPSADSNASMFIDLDDNMHLVITDQSDAANYHFCTPNSDRTAWTFGAANLIWDNPGYPHNATVIAHRNPATSGWLAHVAISSDAADNAAVYMRFAIDSAGGVTTDQALQYAGGPSGGGSSLTWPDLDFHHTGDGKTVKGGTPHVYLVWSTATTGAGQGLVFQKLPYSSGAYGTWTSEEFFETLRCITIESCWMNVHWTGRRVVISGVLEDGSGSAPYWMSVYETALDTDTGVNIAYELEFTDLSLGTFWGRSARVGDDILFFGQMAATPQSVGYRRWVRSSNTLDAFVTYEDLANYDAWVAVPRVPANSIVDVMYRRGTTSPYDVMYDKFVTNAAPNAPSLLRPIDSQTIDLTQQQVFDWDFNDPDTGDTQSKYQRRYRAAGTTTWTEETAVSSSTTQLTDAANFWSAGDWEWQLRTADAAGVWGPYSASEFFTAATPPAAPTITDPADGGTISSESEVMHWTADEQESYQVRKVADDGAGNPDTSQVYYDSGEIQSTTARQRSIDYPVNNRDEHLQLRVKDADGLWSTWSSVMVSVAYEPPATPEITVTAVPEDGLISIDITNPTPVSPQPSVDDNDVFRRQAGQNDTQWKHIATKVAVNGTFNDKTAAAGITYEYYVRANGDNNVSSDSLGATATLDLRYSWIHSVRAPDTTLHQFRYNEKGGEEIYSPELKLNQFAGRKYPVAEYGESEEFQVQVEIRLADRAEMDYLRDLIRRHEIVCYRDSSGRKVFGVIASTTISSAHIGGDTNITVTAVDYEEEV